MTRVNQFAISIFIAAALGGCSGGGGSAPPMSPPIPITTTAPATPKPPISTGNPATPVPTAPPSPVATATPTPAPTASPLSISGKVVNHDTGAPLAGAVVYVSHKLQTTDSAPMAAPADGGEVATAADGTYAMTLPAQGAYPATFFVNVYSPGKVTIHDELTVSGPGVNAVRDLGETTLTTDEANWLILVNQDRAKYGRSPLYTDETTQEVARLWVSWLAKGHYEHNCASGDVNCPDKVAFIAAQMPTFTATGENIDEMFPPSTYQGAESAFMAEAANCPQPADPATCPFAENTGHFINIENSTVVWYGSAEVFGGVSTVSGQSTADYYDQEFSLPNKSGFTVQTKFRSVTSVPR